MYYYIFFNFTFKIDKTSLGRLYHFLIPISFSVSSQYPLYKYLFTFGKNKRLCRKEKRTIVFESRKTFVYVTAFVEALLDNLRGESFALF